MFEQARAAIPEAKLPAMVGDRIASDIEGGRRAGLTTILVLTGDCTREEAESAEPPPDHVVDDLGGLLS
jgi:4-nitrophenyl phosphatase